MRIAYFQEWNFENGFVGSDASDNENYVNSTTQTDNAANEIKRE